MTKDSTDTLDLKWRSMVDECCGGAEFDKPEEGYSFGVVLEEERELVKGNIKGDPSSAMLLLSIADPTWKMHLEAMKAGMDLYHLCPDATRYTDTAGIRARNGTELGDTHEEIVTFLMHRHGVTLKLTPEWVQYSPGSIKRVLSECIPTLFLDPFTVLIFPTPGYPVIKDKKNRRGAMVRNVPMVFQGGQWKMDLLKATEYVGAKRTLMYVNLPHNPTGSGYTTDDWKELLSWARKHKVILVVDEAYIDLRYRDDVVSVLTVPGWEECCVVLQSISKGWSATGTRFGWVVAYPTIIKALRMVMNVKDSGTFAPTIAAGLTCLKNPREAEKTRQRYRDLHQILYEGLRQAGFDTTMPDAGLCQFTPAPTAVNGTVFDDVTGCADWFRRNLRISVMGYTVDEKPWLRWAVTIKAVPECGLPDERSVIEEAVRRLREVKFTF